MLQMLRHTKKRPHQNTSLSPNSQSSLLSYIITPLHIFKEKASTFETTDKWWLSPLSCELPEQMKEFVSEHSAAHSSNIFTLEPAD